MAWTTPATFATNESPLASTKLNTHIRDNMRELWHEVAYVEFTSTVSVSSVAEASPTDVVSSGAITYVANPIIVEFFSPRFMHSAASGGVSLWDTDAINVGRLHESAATGATPMFVSRRLTPSAGSHTYKVRMWASNAAGSAAAGAGVGSAFLPGYIRILQKGGT
jgi:hypothetical protein